MSTSNVVRTSLADNGEGLPIYRPSTVQKVTISGTSAAVSNAFGASTGAVRIVSTTDCYYTVAASPTATVTDHYLPAATIEHILVEPGEKIAFIQSSTGGIATVSELE